MESEALILSDLRTCLAEGKLDFEVLNVYRGVQFVCKALLRQIHAANIVLEVHSPYTALLEVGKPTIILTDGLLDPIRAHILAFDPVTHLLEVGDLVFAGAHVGSRREHRVEPRPRLPVVIVTADQPIQAELADIAMGGAGLHVPDAAAASLLKRSQPVQVHLALPEGHAELPAIVRSLDASTGRLAVEFTDNVLGKAMVLRYLTRCMADIRREVQELYEKQQQSLQQDHSSGES